MADSNFRYPLSRRDWLRAAATTAAGLSVAPLAVLGQAARRPPNVILILADDLGSRDLNCYGASDLLTDNLDRLAAQGTRFDQFYVTAPVCLPSRASLLTGRHPQRVMDPGFGMAGSEVTIAELLGASGYRTAAFGKWHLGHRTDLGPIPQGFDQFVGFKFGAIDNYSHYYYWGEGARPGLWRGSAQRYEGGHYFPDLMTDEAVRFIADEKDRPFFLYLPFNIPHYPMQPSREAYLAVEHIADPARRFYAANVTTMDRCIGRVMQSLAEGNLIQDTIVIFLSDHGHSIEDDTMGGGGRSAPFRGGKMTLWEGGIRVPCIVSWPGTLPTGQLRQQPAMSIDLLPSIADWCDIPLSGLEVDGRSLDAVVRSASASPTHQTLNWSWGKWSAVRRGPWKLVGDEAGENTLSNLSTDPKESQNLLRDEPEIAQQLARHHNDWLAMVQSGDGGSSTYKQK